MTHRTAAFLALALASATAPAWGARVDERTTRVSVAPAGAIPDGPSSRPSVTPGGRYVAFQSTASNLAEDPNGAVSDVFLRDLQTGTTGLVSAAPGGANGPSGSPVVAGAGVVAFVSEASNLVEGDGNGARDVFVRSGGAPPVRVSVAHDGGQANGPSYEPDISRDGRLVVFTSRADNLVPGDVNGVEDVFVRDLRAQTTRRVATAAVGAEPAGRSRAPAISANGRFVSFESTAANLVHGDTNEVPDVFVADLESGRIARVSVSSRERQQNRAVVAPFVQVSDISGDGRYVVFDSDATNLVPRDRNRDTDIFIRDRRRGTTDHVSLTVLGKQPDNDSYFPAISEDGRYVGFSSFAGNIWPRDRGGEDVFVHDRRLRATTPLTVTSTGGVRAKETSPQLLRRPSLSDGARTIGLSSTAPLTRGERDRLEDAVVRLTAPPQGRVLRGPRGRVSSRRPRIRLAADDPRARVFHCRLDGGRAFLCPRDGRLPRLRRGRHRLVVHAGGPGMLFDRTPVVLRFRVR